MTDRHETALDLDALLHPAAAFDHPADVVRDPDLTLNEKRAILSSWASDACAVESVPALRRPPGGKVVTFDDVVDALRSLDAEAERARWKQRHGPFRRSMRDRKRGPSGSGAFGLQ